MARVTADMSMSLPWSQLVGLARCHQRQRRPACAPIRSGSWSPFCLERVMGFEPTNNDLEGRCLTTWRHPRNPKSTASGRLFQHLSHTGGSPWVRPVNQFRIGHFLEAASARSSPKPLAMTRREHKSVVQVYGLIIVGDYSLARGMLFSQVDSNVRDITIELSFARKGLQNPHRGFESCCRPDYMAVIRGTSAR
jgi:hypothetical protein